MKIFLISHGEKSASYVKEEYINASAYSCFTTSDSCDNIALYKFT